MKLVTFTHNSNTHIGALRTLEDKEYVVDLNRLEPGLPLGMLPLLRAGATALDLAAKTVEKAAPADLLPLGEVKLQAPLPNPTKILCLGLNYRDHAAEGNKPIPETPTIFSKYNNCVIGPSEAILMPKVTSQVDYEAELAFVIGRGGKHISEAEALEHVAGYLALNDVSARDYQTRTSQWTIGKIFDTFAPMGPALVTSDEIPDPGSLEISLTLNGQELQHSNTRHLIFSIPYIIAYLSQVLTLEPGDVISTGTPAGVGVARKPPVFLKPGDEVSVHIEKIGVLTNQVAAEA